MDDMGSLFLIWLVMNSILFAIVLAVKRPVNAELVVGALIACFLLSVLGFILILITWQNDQHVPKAVTTSSLDKANAFFGSKPKPQPQRIAGNGVGKIGQAVGITIVAVGAVAIALASLLGGDNSPVSSSSAESNVSRPRSNVSLRVTAETPDYTKPNLHAIKVVNVGSGPITLNQIVINKDPKCAATRETVRQQVKQTLNALNGNKAPQKETTKEDEAGLDMYMAMIGIAAPPSLPIELGVGGWVQLGNTCGEIVTANILTDLGDFPYRW